MKKIETTVLQDPTSWDTSYGHEGIYGTLEELYQAFKKRLICELMVESSKLLNRAELIDVSQPLTKQST